MKKCVSLYMFIIALCFCVAGVFLTDPFVYAETQANVSLINPHAIACNSTELFVADTIEENQSEYTIVHRIGKGITSYFLDFSVAGAALDMCVNDNYIFLLQQDKILIYDFVSDSVVKEFSQTNLCAFAVSGDILFFAYSSNGDNYVGALLYQQQQMTSLTPYNYRSTQIRFLKASERDKVIVFFETESSCRSEKVGREQNRVVDIPDTATSLPQDVFDETLGVVNYGEYYLYTADHIKLFINSTDDYSFWDIDGILVKDICILNNNLYVLCDYLVEEFYGENNDFYLQPRIKKYQLSDTPTQSVTIIEQWEFGASKVSLTPPTYQLDKITVARVTGYPSNVVYTSDQSTSYNAISKNKLAIDDVILVLSDKADDFLFVCLQGYFGWIPNSEKVVYDTTKTNLDIQAVTVINANLYSLPFLKEEFFSHIQLQKDAQVTVKASINDFCLIAYETEDQEISFGFCAQTCIGAFREELTYTTYLRKKANPKAGQKITLYLTNRFDKEENNFVLDQNQNQILIKSGAEVRLYGTGENGACYVGVFADDVLFKGYIKSEQLLKDISKGLTNAKVLALALFAIVVLVVIFVIIIRIRAKKLIQQNNKEEQ